MLSLKSSLRRTDISRYGMIVEEGSSLPTHAGKHFLDSLASQLIGASDQEQ